MTTRPPPVIFAPLETRNIKAIVKALRPWFAANARDLPWRRTKDPYLIAVSEIMLQQTQVKTVIPFWERWVRELPTLADVARADAGRLHKLWEGLGYYTRVRNFQQATQLIMTRHDGQFPTAFADVLALPGMGRYTAGAICSIAFNQPTPILDGNVIRVLTRIFGIAENPRDKITNARLWQLAEALVSHAAKSRARARSGRKDEIEADGCSHLNQSLMELGALVCTPRNAQCRLCPVQPHCAAFREGRVEALPNLVRREPATVRRFVAFLVERGGKFLVRQRPAAVVNAHLWEFPNVEVHRRPVPAEIFQTEFGRSPREIQPLVTIKHSITRYRITVEAFRVTAGPGGLARHGAQWKTPAQLQPLAFTSAHRKIWHTAGSAGFF